MPLFASRLTTLVFIDEARVVRADVDVARQRVVALRSQPRPLDANWAGLVEMALTSGSRPGNTVWVLPGDAWSQQVSVPGLTLEGLSDAETARALAFEAESLSGITAFTSRVAFIRLGVGEGVRRFWVTQLPGNLCERIDQVVRERGSKLGGILHPAGLPHSLSSAAAGKWRRCEIWPGMALEISSQDAQLEYRWLANERGQVKPTGQAWDESLCVSSGANPPAATQTFRLGEQSELEQWLLRWATALASRALPVPAVRPDPRPPGRELYVAAAVIFAILALGAAWFDRMQLLGSVADNEKEAARLKADTETHQNRRKELEGVQKELLAVTEENQSLEKEIVVTESMLQAQQRRWRRLLVVLGHHSSPDLVIQEIATDSGSVEIRGKCLGTDAANRCARRVADELRSCGWGLMPSQKAFTGSEVYDFRWTLTELSAEQMASASRSIMAQRDLPPRGKTPINSADTGDGS